MKKIISLMSLFFVFVACNNAGDKKEESKDTSTTVDQVVKKRAGGNRKLSWGHTLCRL